MLPTNKLVYTYIQTLLLKNKVFITEPRLSTCTLCGKVFVDAIQCATGRVIIRNITGSRKTVWICKNCVSKTELPKETKKHREAEYLQRHIVLVR